MDQSAISILDTPTQPSQVCLPAEGGGGGLLELFAAVSDGRSDQGRDHPVAVVLALAAAAVVAGMRGYTAIAGWVTDVPEPLRRQLYERGQARRPAIGPPSKATIWRVVTDTDAQAFDSAIGTWLMARLVDDTMDTGSTTQTSSTSDCEGGQDDSEQSGLVQVRLDGKVVRGATDADGTQVHLLAALVGRPGDVTVVAAQGQIDSKSNEVPHATEVLDQIPDLRGAVVTADALHTVKATATHIHARGAFYMLPAKENRQALYQAVNALPWAQTPIGHTRTDTGHARITRRTIRVLPAPANLPFPHAEQVYLIERYVTDLRGEHPSAAAALGVTNLPAHLAGPPDLAAYAQDHWGVESLHWLRDTLYREDTSTTRTRSGPRIMATLRNLAIGALRLAGRRDITEATRWANRYMHRPFTILQLTT
ncbi:ISAs1 family transposase [Micromonospora sp. ATA32]|nr:ISAs1 family transposase [Micromonospora sp. ATA32]